MNSATGKLALTAGLLLICTLQGFGGPINLATNGSFENTGGVNTSFAIQGSNGGTNALPGWSIGTNPPTPGAYPNVNNPLDCLMFGGQTTGLCGAGNTGPGGPNNPSGAWAFYTYPGASPDGGNFIGVDGDSTISAPLSQSVSGLTVGTQYTLAFDQAAAQQQGFVGDTTEDWRVTLGGSTQSSTLMSTPSKGTTAWNLQTMTFTATSTTEVLSFFAVGTPNGLPPFVLLDGVSLTANTPSSTPEPSTAFLFAAGLLGLPMLRRLRKNRP